MTPKRHHFRLAAAGPLSWWSDWATIWVSSVLGPKITKTNWSSPMTSFMQSVCCHVSRGWGSRYVGREIQWEGEGFGLPRHIHCTTFEPSLPTCSQLWHWACQSLLSGTSFTAMLWSLHGGYNTNSHGFNWVEYVSLETTRKFWRKVKLPRSTRMYTAGLWTRGIVLALNWGF